MAYCECSAPTASGIRCACPDGTVVVDQIGALDLPPADLIRLGEFSISASAARSRGDHAAVTRILADRDTYQRDAIARLKSRLGGRRADDMREIRMDHPRTDALRADAAELSEAGARLDMEIRSAVAYLPESERAQVAEKMRRNYGERVTARLDAARRAGYQAARSDSDAEAAALAAERRMLEESANAWKTGG